ncbi:hypothetical protein K0U00_50815, partial [Paenibacillus sepulcri]|nr:hypothetical protein [Paenibacillus sepulcri]
RAVSVQAAKAKAVSVHPAVKEAARAVSVPAAKVKAVDNVRQVKAAAAQEASVSVRTAAAAAQAHKAALVPIRHRRTVAHKGVHLTPVRHRARMTEAARRRNL